MIIMDFKLEDLTPEQINILHRFNKNYIINNLLVLEHQKEKRNNYHRLYYNKLKTNDEKFNKLKMNRKDYYLNIKNDEEKYKTYLNKMKQYNHDYLNRKNLKSEDIKQDKPLKNIKLNYIISDEEYYIINVNKFITNFEDLEIINKKIKQIIINKNDVNDIFLKDDIFNEINIKNFIVNKYNNIIKFKPVLT
jgi:hypothetical protein